MDNETDTKNKSFFAHFFSGGLRSAFIKVWTAIRERLQSWSEEEEIVKEEDFDLMLNNDEQRRTIQRARISK